MRYFVNFYRNQPHTLWRFNVEPDRILEERWDGMVWTPTTYIAQYLTDGEANIEEITLELARKAFPLAVDEMAKSIGAYEVQKAEGDKRYTLGAMYIPDRIDAHGEWTDSDELQRAVWDYVRTNDRRIRLQHNREIVAGEWVEVMSFPYEMTVPIKTPSGIEVNHTYPANTVFLGVIWEDWAWEKIQRGEILGYSIGGRAERLYVDMEKSDPTATDVHVDTIMNPSKKKPKKEKQ